ncbi:MAG: SulP family inorganic anion transporter [Nitratireductor sp.]
MRGFRARDLIGLLQGLSLRQFFPFLAWRHMVTAQNLKSDALAGLTGATIVLPQAVAFAAIAGLPPEYGFYTAMVTPIIAALFGSSWHVVSGPTTAISALLLGALSDTFEPGSAAFIQAAITMTLLVGIFQLALGLARLGALVDFVSHSVMVGFMAGAASLVGLSQLGSALGIELPPVGKLFAFLSAVWENAPNADWRSLLIAAVALFTGVVSKKYFPRLPNYLIALLLGSIVSFALEGPQNGVKLVGAIPDIIPGISIPNLNLDTLGDMAPAAFAIALVGLLEAVSIARAVAIKSGQDLDGNQEFMGQGLSNTVGSFFQCYAGSGSFTRSGVNYEAGAKTPLAAVMAAVFLFLILLFVAPLFAYVPIPAMAGVIILVAWKLIDFKELWHIIETSRAETAIAFITFASTVFINLEFAIYIGVMMSFLIFLNKSAHPYLIINAPDPKTKHKVFRSADTHELVECPQLVFVRLDGPFYFGSVEHIRRKFRSIERLRAKQKHMLFMVKGVGEIDLPAAELMIEEARRRKRRGGTFHVQAKAVSSIQRLDRFHVSEALSTEHVHTSKGDAINEIVPTLDQSICATCTARIFNECPGLVDGFDLEAARAEEEKARLEKAKSKK